MSDELDEAVTGFLNQADSVYDEYEQGYVDADAALSMLESHVESLRDVAREQTSAENWK